MTKFEQFILTDFVPNNSKQDENGRYIIDSDKIEELNLNPIQKEFLYKTLKAYQIGIVEQEKKITQEFRSPLISDFNYGTVSSENDGPVYSNIQYEMNGDTTFEDYSQLEDFLDKKFIPTTIQTKKFKDPITEDIEFYSSIPLNKIIKLKLSELEVKHTIEFLELRDIRVTGMNSTLDSEFNNYDYIMTYKNQHLPETKSWEEQLEWFKEYHRTKNPQIRQKIIEANLRLVPFITYKIAYTYKIDINELNSYGYESLIDIIDKFELSKGTKFSTFAFTTIRRYIYQNLASLLGFKNLTVYNNFISAMKNLTNLYEQNGIDKEIAIEEITDFICNQHNYGERKRKNVFNEIAIGNMGNIDDFTESEEYIEDFSLSRSILNSCSHKEIMKVLNTLTDREKFVLIQRYGLEDGKFKSQETVGNMVGLSRTRIAQIEEHALRRLRHYKRREPLLALLENYDKLNYDETVHFRKI